MQAAPAAAAAEKNQSACDMNLISDMIAFHENLGSRWNLTSVSNVVLHNLHTLGARSACAITEGLGVHQRAMRVISEVRKLNPLIFQLPTV